MVLYWLRLCFSVPCLILVFQTTCLLCNKLMPCVLWRFVCILVWHCPVIVKSIRCSNSAIELSVAIPFCVKISFCFIFAGDVHMFVFTIYFLLVNSRCGFWTVMCSVLVTSGFPDIHDWTCVLRSMLSVSQCLCQFVVNYFTIDRRLASHNSHMLCWILWPCLFLFTDPFATTYYCFFGSLD